MLVIIAIAVLFLVLAIPAIKDRERLYEPKRYGILAVISPAMGIGTVCLAIGTEYNPFFVIISLAVLVLTAYVYILLHKYPIDKTDEKYAEYTEKELAYAAAKRMIKSGIIGEILYTVLTFFAACITDSVSDTFGETSEEFMPETILLWLLVMLLLGAALLAVAMLTMVCAIGIIPESAFVTHGCIKFILVQEYTKPQKFLLILLSLIPLINIIYGICLIKKMSDDKTPDYT